VRALDSRLVIAGSIPAASLSSVTFDKSFKQHLPLSSLYQRKLGCKQVDFAKQWSCGFAALNSVWLKATESAISAAKLAE